MIRKNFYLTEEQAAFLKHKKDISVSEHIRRAIDEYIEKLKNNSSSVSPSVKLLDKQ